MPGAIIGQPCSGVFLAARPRGRRRAVVVVVDALGWGVGQVRSAARFSPVGRGAERAAGWSGSQRPSQKSRVGGILVLARLDPAQFWEWSSKNSRGKSCSAAWLLSGARALSASVPVDARADGPFLFSWLGGGGKTLSATSRPDRFTALLITLHHYAGFVPGVPLPRSLLLEGTLGPSPLARIYFPAVRADIYFWDLFAAAFVNTLAPAGGVLVDGDLDQPLPNPGRVSRGRASRPHG